MALQLDDMILGESDEPLLIDGSEPTNAGMQALAKQAKRSINIFTHHLDNKIYDNQALYDSLFSLATSSRYALIRILILDSQPVVKRGNRLVRLSQRLTSRVLIRKPPIEFQNHREELFIVDDCGILYRPVGNRYEGELAFNNPVKVRQSMKFFDDCWEKSATDPELRVLGI